MEEDAVAVGHAQTLEYLVGIGLEGLEVHGRGVFRDELDQQEEETLHTVG